MNILRLSNRSGLVKLKEHQMQDKITDFFGTYCQIFICIRFYSLINHIFVLITSTLNMHINEF